MKESDLQEVIVKFLTLRGLKFFHTPNGGYRNPREAAKFKRMGVKAGIPDIIIYSTPRKQMGLKGLTFELKVGSNKITQHQEQRMEEFKDEGWAVYVVRSLDEAMEIIANHY